MRHAASKVYYNFFGWNCIGDSEVQPDRMRLTTPRPPKLVYSTTIPPHIL